MRAREIVNGVRAQAAGLREAGFPLEVMPQGVQQMVLDLAEAEGFVPEYTASVMLSAVGAALGNAVHVHIKGSWVANAALYMILVGSPGMGKTPPLNAVYRPLQQMDDRRLAEYIDARKAWENARHIKNDEGESPEEPVLVQTIINDFTPEAMMKTHDVNRRGVVILVDEIMGMFNTANRYNSSNLIEVLLSAFSGSAIKVTRMNNPMPLYVASPCVSIIGTTQTRLAGSLFGKGYEDNGLLDRFLFVLPRRQRIRDWSDAATTTSCVAAQRWATLIEKVSALEFRLDDQGHINPLVLDFSPEARTRFYAWHNAEVAKVNAIKNDADVDSRPMKRDVVVARLALILQTMAWAADEGHMEHVALEAVEGAILLSDYYEDCYRRLMVDVGRADSPSRDEQILAQLADEFTTADAINVGRDYMLERSGVNKLLARLRAAGRIVAIKHGHYRKTANVPNVPNVQGEQREQSTTEEGQSDD